MIKQLSIVVNFVMLSVLAACTGEEPVGPEPEEEAVSSQDALSAACGACVRESALDCFQSSQGDIQSCLFCDACAAECADVSAFLCGGGSPGGGNPGGGSPGGGNPGGGSASFCYSLACGGGQSTNQCFTTEADYCASLCAETVCSDLAARQCAASCN